VLGHDRSGSVHPSQRAVGPFVNFNDGTLCAASGIIRMGVVFPTAGVGVVSGWSDAGPIHIAGAPVLLAEARRRRRSTTSAGTATSRRGSAIRRGTTCRTGWRLFGRLTRASRVQQ
jgi:hypothetical protein